MPFRTARLVAAALALAGALAAPAALAAEWTLTTDELRRLAAGEVLVALDTDPGESWGPVRAAVQIAAPAERVFRIMTDCAEALEFVRHLERCEVLESAPDGSWQLIGQEVDYAWYLPRARYVFRADYEPYTRVVFTHVSGDFRRNEGEWTLSPAPDGTGTIVKYRADVVPQFYVPRWLMRVSLRRELPDMLRALRARCERAPAHTASQRKTP